MTGHTDAVVERNFNRWLERVQDNPVRFLSRAENDEGSGVSRAFFLDVRDAQHFASTRLRWSSNVPLRALDEGAAYLVPPRTARFALICDADANVDEAAKKFESDFKGVAWSLEAAFAGTPAFFDACAAIDESDATESKYNGLFEVVRGGGTPAPRDRLRLWQPSPELARWLPSVERKMDAFKDGRRPTCLDVGSGAGRDAVWVASRGWNVVAIDNDKRGLDRCRSLAERHGVEASVRTLDLDLNKRASEETLATIDKILALESWSPVLAVYAVRYLHKPFVRDLPRMLPNRSAVLWFHFMRGCERTSVGRPTKDRDLLEPNELRDVFALWDVIIDDVVELPDGRPVSSFAVVRGAKEV